MRQRRRGRRGGRAALGGEVGEGEAARLAAVGTKRAGPFTLGSTLLSPNDVCCPHHTVAGGDAPLHRTAVGSGCRRRWLLCCASLIAATASADALSSTPSHRQRHDQCRAASGRGARRPTALSRRRSRPAGRPAAPRTQSLKPPPYRSSCTPPPFLSSLCLAVPLSSSAFLVLVPVLVTAIDQNTSATVRLSPVPAGGSQTQVPRQRASPLPPPSPFADKRPRRLRQARPAMAGATPLATSGWPRATGTPAQTPPPPPV